MSEDDKSTEVSKDPFEAEQAELKALVDEAPNEFFRSQRKAAGEGRTTRYAWLALTIVLFSRITH